ncbi:YfbM family protein [Ruminococcus sp. Marseille-P6503]|uniref:YfbM family protein n=1 Tax=Ruminococcus sp. Marseille-P6503 TaxID=2364796 RepID=UPI000F53CE88|nr:YfbM family protein [Ruminococcus sp. Marseille-P6503]
MSCLGVLFAVPEDVVGHIKALPMEERPEYISLSLEELYFEDYPERTAELDKAWDAIHRSLTDGTLSFDCGEYPLGGVILGGEILYYDGAEYDDYIITAKSPEEVKNIYTQLAGLTKKQFREGYDKIDETYPDERGDEDFEYSWEYLQDAVPFFRLAAEKGLWVLFTADQ